MAGENAAVLQPDSTGKAIRLLDVVTYINGVLTTVEMQVVAIADAGGNPLSLDPVRTATEDTARECRMQTELLIKIVNALTHENINRNDVLALLEEGSDREEGATHSEAYQLGAVQ